MPPSVAELHAAGVAAMQEGRWAEARASFDAVLAQRETAEACFALASVLWWSGEDRASVTACTRAWTLFRRTGDVTGAVQCAVWLAVTFKANFANHAASNGWARRAERLLSGTEVGCLHAWVWIARAYRLADTAEAEGLTRRALDVARAEGDVDLELVALAQWGLIRVGNGDTAGFDLIDEAMAGVLGGEGTSLDTVVYICCDMLTACELVADLERAAQWCDVADRFVERYGCPFLFAECRTAYGSVLADSGRWADAEHHLTAALRATVETCPALRSRAMVRLAELRVRQGRLEEADRLLDELADRWEARHEAARCRAAVLLGRGDAAGAVRALTTRSVDAADLLLLVDANLAAGEVAAAAVVARRLSALATGSGDRVEATAALARGRVAIAEGRWDAAAAELEAAVAGWTRQGLPFESARASFDAARVQARLDPVAAVELARRALATFERLGAATEADRVAAFLRSLGVVPRPGQRSGVGLTRREREVLELLALGLTNPEIAGRLHVSRKTASHHVSNVLAKLGVRNRAEAAAHAARVGAR